MRPNSEIDFSIVDDMLEAGCTGVEVAARLGMHPDTLYRHVQDELGVGFAAYRQQKIASGDQKLREKLYGKAIGGDTATLIFLGKTRLGMTEKMEVEHSLPQGQGVAIQIGFRAPGDVVPGEGKSKTRLRSSKSAD